METLAQQPSDLLAAVEQLGELLERPDVVALYEARLKANLDARARERAWEEAFAEGKREIAKKMWKFGLPPEEIATYTDLPLQQVQEYIEALSKQK
jgi:predicted transposase/invertase (TIGR01784 family)